MLTSPGAGSNARDDAAAYLRALRRHRARLDRKRVAIEGDLEEAKQGHLYRRVGEALLTYLSSVPKRAAVVTLPDPTDHNRTLDIVLDPSLSPQANAAKYFKRAAKAERGLQEIPARLQAVVAELERVSGLLEDIEALAADDEPDASRSAALQTIARRIYDILPPVLRRELQSPRNAVTQRGDDRPRGTTKAGQTVPKPSERLPARLVPRRLRSSEGWDVLIGRTNEGNDHLTHRMARPEDYWFHVHGAPGSHVVLRRGKGKNEPSKQTIEEVASWAAFYSQARTAGKVPVIVTRKKYVRKPRKGPPGLALCEREKTVIVRPVEPPRSALADEADAAT